MNGYTPESLAGVRVDPGSTSTWGSLDKQGGRADPVVLVVTDDESSSLTAEGSPEPESALPALGPSEGGFGTLRALLLGEEAPDERRRLEAIEQRLETLAAQLDEVASAARGSDVVLGSLAALQQQIDALRHEQEHQTTIAVERLRQVDDRCRARQRRARASSHLELRRLRQRIYATGNLPSLAQHMREGGPRRDDRPLWPLENPDGSPAYAASRSSTTTRDARSLGAPPLTGENAGLITPATAWMAVRAATVALFHALALLWVAVFYAISEDARAAMSRLRDMGRR